MNSKKPKYCDLLKLITCKLQPYRLEYRAHRLDQFVFRSRAMSFCVCIFALDGLGRKLKNEGEQDVKNLYDDRPKSTV